MSSGSRRGRSNHNSNQGTVWEVIEIVEEDGKLYKVRWAGKDPKTGKPWPLDWIPSSHCSPELVKAWERKKAKKQTSLVSAPISASHSASVTRKRPSMERNATGTPEPPVRSTRKRKHRAPSGSPDNAEEDSVPPPRKKLTTTTVERATSSNRSDQSTAHTHSVASRKEGRLIIEPPHPPLEEIEVWVPTPNAKFGPPKRKRAAGEGRVSPKDGSEHAPLSAIIPAQASRPVPSPPRSLKPSESLIVALREEEEEDSQLQLPDLEFAPSSPEDCAPNSAPGDPLPPAVDDVRVATEVLKSLGPPERSTRQASEDVQLTNPKTGKALVSEPNNQSIHIQPNASNASIQGGGTTKTPKGFSPLPNAPHISLINLNPSNSAASSSKSPQLEKPAQSAPPPTGRPSATPIEQLSSKSEPLQSGGGTLAERRAFEARVRLEELRRAGAGFGSIAKGYIGASKTPQTPQHAPPHVVLKQVMHDMESPSQSQNATSGNSGVEMRKGASPSEHRRTEPSDGYEEERIVRNKSDDNANVGSLRQQDDVVAADVLVVHDEEVSSEDEVPATASSSGGSQSQNPSPHVPLASQLAAALGLLHKKSEEISELRAQVDKRRRTTNGTNYLAVEIQTEQESDAYIALNSERARWTQEKAALQDEVDTLRGDKARALADVDFFRDQYQRASAFASSTRSENEELLARAELAESQTVNGVALVRATLEARVTKLEAEVQQYKALSDLLTERARRTDDEVRYRAACMPELERENRQLRQQFRETEAELEEANDELRAEKRTNIRLKRRIASLKAKERPDEGIFRTRDRVPWNDDEDDEDYRPDDDPSSFPRGDGDVSSPQHHQGSHSPHNEDGAGPADVEPEQLASVGFEVIVQPRKEDMVYLCRWRPGKLEGYCDAVVASKQELHEHVFSHHLSCH